MRGLLAVLVVAAPGRTWAESCPPLDHTHAAWTALLATHVADGLVDYDGFARDRPRLERYLDATSSVCSARYATWTRAQRIAFWLNVYNARTVALVLAEMPIDSIRDIGWLPGAAFRRSFIPMQGLGRGEMSLDDIEHRTLRADPALGDPRIHFVLVCAALSCPPLRAEAYRGADLEVQLDDQGRRFLRDASKNRWDAATRTLHLSAIFKWFREDFETDGMTLPAFVAPYLPPEAGDAVREDAVRIRFERYDWSLNRR